MCNGRCRGTGRIREGEWGCNAAASTRYTACRSGGVEFISKVGDDQAFIGLVPFRGGAFSGVKDLSG